MKVFNTIGLNLACISLFDFDFFAFIFIEISFQIKFQRVFVHWLIHWHSLSVMFVINLLIKTHKEHTKYIFNMECFFRSSFCARFYDEHKGNFFDLSQNFHMYAFNLYEYALTLYSIWNEQTKLFKISDEVKNYIWISGRHVHKWV